MRAGVPSAFSSRRARNSGDGRHSFSTSRTSSGISIQRSWLTSCLISSIGNNGARSCGPIGLPVPGCSTGGAGDLKSAWMLYHFDGMSFSSRRNFVRFLSVALAAIPALLAETSRAATLSQSSRRGVQRSPPVLPHEARDRGHEIGRLQWLGDMHLKPGRERACAIFGACVSGHGESRDRPHTLGLLRSELLDQRIAIVAGQADVTDEKVGMPLLHLLESLVRVGGGHDLGTRRAQDHAHELARIRLVVDDENAQSVQIDQAAARFTLELPALRLPRDMR